MALLIAGYSFLYLEVTNLKDKNSELSLKAERLDSRIAEVDSRTERVENQIVLLKEEGYVEVSDISVYAKNILPSVVFIMLTKEMLTQEVLKAADSSSYDREEIAVTEDLENVRGTGFFISSDGYIVTATHVVSDLAVEDIEIRDAGGNRFEVEQIITADKTDVSLIKIKSFGVHPTTVFGHFENIKIGSEIGIVGFNPGFSVPLLHQGTISSIGFDGQGSEIFTINSFVNKGNSGSPVFSKATGRVLGVLSTRKSEAQLHRLLDPDNFNSGVSLGGNIDPLRFSAELYNETVRVVEEVSQVGIGVVYSIDIALDLLKEVRK